MLLHLNRMVVIIKTLSTLYCWVNKRQKKVKYLDYKRDLDLDSNPDYNGLTINWNVLVTNIKQEQTISQRLLFFTFRARVHFPS